MNEEGTWTKKGEEIQEVIVDYFFKLFRPPNQEEDGLKELGTFVPGKVTEEMNRGLDRPFTSQKVVAALKQMDPLKAPDPDVLPALFFRRYWDIVRQNVVKAVSEILNKGAKVGNMETTLVALIPKVQVCLFDHVNLCPLYPKSSNLQSSTTSLKSAIAIFLKKKKKSTIAL